MRLDAADRCGALFAFFGESGADESASLTRDFNVSLHTHLAENDNDVRYSQEKFNRTPAQYVEELDWVGHDVWHAHCVKLDDYGIKLFARTGMGIAHCPCSNMRLASGITPVRRMPNAGVNVGLGVDGSASNDTADMIGDAAAAGRLWPGCHDDQAGVRTGNA